MLGRVSSPAKPFDLDSRPRKELVRIQLLIKRFKTVTRRKVQKSSDKYKWERLIESKFLIF